MESGRDLSRRSFGREYFRGSLEAPRDLNAEVYQHGILPIRRMMTEEDVVTIGAQAGILPQERPHLVESRLPRGGNLTDANLATNSGK